MEHTTKDNTLILTLPERVSELNAMDVKREGVDLAVKYPKCSITIDCEKLKYISSSGLRALLSIQKKKGKEKITLKNVKREVNEILEMTGFDDIFNVVRPLKNVNLKECVAVSKCINGTLYRFQKGIMLKAFNRFISMEQAAEELEMTKKALTCGLSVPISYTVVRCGECYGILYEDIAAKSIADLILENSFNLDFYAIKLADFVKELHATEVTPGVLPSIKERYQGWLSDIEEGVDPKTIAGMRAMVDRMEDSNTFVHGNISLRNVFMVDGELMMMDMSSCGYGHPIFDLQSLYASLVAIEIDNPGYCERTTGLSAKQCRNFWKKFIMRYLEVEDVFSEAEKKKQASMNQLLEQYYILKEQLLDELEKRK